MAFGIEVADGWYNIIDNLCGQIMKTNPPDGFRAAQVKEKFGGLRFYVIGATEEIDNLIDVAEDKSFKICEMCGTDKNITTEGSYILTLCKSCRKKRSKIVK